MNPLGAQNPFARRTAYETPDHILFPEDYEATKRMIVRDFIFFGAYIVGGIVAVAFIGTAL